MVTRTTIHHFILLRHLHVQFMRSVVKAPVRARTPVMGPAILVSGYLAKRTRTLGRWKKRWWQLTDDGTLLYFKSEDRTKALGEIDVARSCYDVKFGTDQCKVEFPRAVPSCCCFSFSVLKRTYYLYAASPADAKVWAESIANVSVVLNYRKKISHRPAPDPPVLHKQRPVSNPCLPIEEKQQNSEDRGGGIEKRSYSMPGRLPRLHASVSGDITCLPTVSESEAADKPTELPRIAERGKGRVYRVGRTLTSENWYGSAPSLQSGNPRQSQPRSSAPHHPSNARLWLDGSPAPNARMGRKTPRQHRKRGHRIFQPTIHQPLHMQSSMYGGSLDKLPMKRQAPIDTGSRKMFTRWPVDMDGYELPPRPQSVDVSMLHTKRPPFSIPPTQKVTTSVPPSIVPSLSTEQTSSIDEATHKNTPPPVKPKPILKKSRPASSLDGEQSVQSVSDSDSVLSPPEIPPKRYIMKVSVNSVNGKRNVFLPPPPDFKPPPPPEHSSGNSSPISMSAAGNTHDQNSVSSVTDNRTVSQPKDTHYEPHSFNTASRYLQQVCVYMLIKMCVCVCVCRCAFSTNMYVHASIQKDFVSLLLLCSLRCML